jgi:uncharacterized protein (DUF427 family)
VLAESDKYEMLQANVYSPPESVRWECFSEGDMRYTCPWNGETNKNASWSCPDPKPAARQIIGHVAFEKSKGIHVK